MQFRPETRAVIRQRIGLLMDEMLLLTVSGGAPDLFAAEAIKQMADDALAGRVAYALGTAQTRVIVGSSSADGTAFITPSWTPPPAGGLVEVWREDLHPSRVNNVINLAILDIHEIVNVPLRLPPEAISADRLELTVPEGMTKVSGVMFRTASGGAFTVYEAASPDWMAQYPNAWTLIGNSLFVQPKIPDTVALADVHLLGYGLPIELDLDSDLCQVPAEYVIYLGAFLLDAGESGSQVTDPEQHGPKAAGWLRQALLIRDRIETAWSPNTIEVGP